MTMSSIPAALEAQAKRFPLREFTAADGLQWSFRDTQGAGKVLVMLPGAAGGGDVAYKLVDALQDKVRAISVGYPGGLAPAALSNGLAELLDHLAIAEVAVWGSSYGAWWAEDFAVRHASRVSALWLGNCFIDGADIAHIPLFDLAWIERSAPDDVKARWLDATFTRPPSELRDLQLYFIEQTISAESLRGRLIQVASSTGLPAATGIARTVVCDCEDDPIIAPPVRDRVAARYPRATHLRLPAGGHYPHLSSELATLERLHAALQQWLDL